jgi:hypothetical protein
MTANLLMNELLCGSPSEARAWLQEVVSGSVNALPDFNWLGFAFAAGSNAHETARRGDKPSSLGWAKVAVSVYEKLAATSEEYESHACEMSAMNLRASLINKFGSSAGHDILDGEAVVNWFWEKLELPLEEVKEVSRQWHELGYEEKVERLKNNPSPLLAIMRIKNRLGVIDVLRNGGIVPLSDEIQSWLVARGQFA